MKDNNRKAKTKKDGKMLLPLCGRCVAQFYNSGAHRVYRVDPKQKIKDTCAYCGQHTGFDYVIKNKEKKNAKTR
jgi:RNase P subunit RPR2